MKYRDGVVKYGGEIEEKLMQNSVNVEPRNIFNKNVLKVAKHNIYEKKKFLRDSTRALGT